MAFSPDRALLKRVHAGENDAVNALMAQLVRGTVERQLLRYPVADEDRRRFSSRRR